MRSFTPAMALAVLATVVVDGQAQCDAMAEDASGPAVDIEARCSTDNCEVLAYAMYDRTCDDFCAGYGYACKEAYEEDQSDSLCTRESNTTCSTTGRNAKPNGRATWDLICVCDPSVSDVTTTTADEDQVACADITNAGPRGGAFVTCSADGCTSLAGNMTDRTCEDFCGEFNSLCVSAAEEARNTCKESTRFPDVDCTTPGGSARNGSDTSDLLCTCAPKTTTTTTVVTTTTVATTTTTEDATTTEAPLAASMISPAQAAQLAQPAPLGAVPRLYNPSAVAEDTRAGNTSGSFLALGLFLVALSALAVVFGGTSLVRAGRQNAGEEAGEDRQLLEEGEELTME